MTKSPQVVRYAQILLRLLYLQMFLLAKEKTMLTYKRKGRKARDILDRIGRRELNRREEKILKIIRCVHIY